MNAEDQEQLIESTHARLRADDINVSKQDVARMFGVKMKKSAVPWWHWAAWTVLLVSGIGIATIALIAWIGTMLVDEKVRTQSALVIGFLVLFASVLTIAACGSPFVRRRELAEKQESKVGYEESQYE